MTGPLDTPNCGSRHSRVSIIAEWTATAGLAISARPCRLVHRCIQPADHTYCTYQSILGSCMRMGDCAISHTLPCLSCNFLYSRYFTLLVAPRSTDILDTSLYPLESANSHENTLCTRCVMQRLCGSSCSARCAWRLYLLSSDDPRSWTMRHDDGPRWRHLGDWYPMLIRLVLVY